MSRRPPHAIALAVALPVLALLVAPAFAPHAAAQGPAASSAPSSAPARGAFGEVVDVRVIDLEVVVTDRRGRRVQGLGRDDFRLTVDGEETAVAFFDEVREGTLAPPLVAAEDEAAPLSRVAFDEGAGVSYLLFLDDYFSHAKDRARVLAGFRADLADLGPDDRMAAVAWDGQRLELLLPWSGERTAVETALAAADGRQASRAWVEQQRATSPEALARLIAGQLDRTYAALAATLRAFADAPGRRVALVVSGGWPYDAANAVLGFGGARSPLWDARGPLRQVADVANATGFTLYTIDAVGNERRPEGDVRRESVGRPEDADFIAAMSAVLRRAAGGGESQGGPVDVSAGSPGTGGEGLGAAALNADAATFQRDDAREFEKESTLLVLAELTGGRAAINLHRDRALGIAADDVRNYYWLGFYHSRSGDGRERSLRVEVVGRPELEVRARRGFVDLPPTAEARFATERTLLFGAAPPGTARLAVALGEARRAGREVELPFRVTVPLAELTLAEAADGVHARLELQVAVEDDKGRRSELAAIPMDLVLTPAEAAGGEVVYDAALRLRPRRHDLVFTLADAATGKTLVARAEFAP